jgi:hypothetical protein
MRQAKVGLGLLLLLGAGCDPLHGGMFNRDRNDRPVTDKPPQAAELIDWMNWNARKVQGIQADDVALDCKENGRGIGLSGQLAAQKPHFFLLKARLAGQDFVNVGSNDQELWYWISKVEPVPYVFHCDHAEMARGGARMPFPFQPDMVMSALGLAEYDPKKSYELKVNPQTLELIEPAMSPQGQPVKKVTVFDRMQAAPGKPQVVAHILRDQQGKEICTARVVRVQQVPLDRSGGNSVTLPYEVVLAWPDQKLEMRMRLGKLRSATFEQERLPVVFSRRALADLPSYDLARGAADQPGGVGQNQSFQRTGGFPR